MSVFKELTVNGQISTQPARVQGQASVTPVRVGGNLIMTGSSADPYQGTYEVTPTETTQVLATSGKRLTEDIIVHPIPSNYGQISWDGSTLTVS
jgi:hypothetical protein